MYVSGYNLSGYNFRRNFVDVLLMKHVEMELNKLANIAITIPLQLTLACVNVSKCVRYSHVLTPAKPVLS